MNNTKAILKYSFFTADLTRALKSNRSRIHCNVDGDGMIYVCNGYFVVKLTGAEYDALVRSVTQRDAGNWALNENGEISPDPINLVNILRDADKSAAHSITAAPLVFDAQKPSDKFKLVGYYSETGDFVTAFNPSYAAIVSPALERKSGGSVNPMVIYAAEGEAVAMILPVRVDDKPNVVRTIRAWFADENSAAHIQEESNQLRREAEQLRQDYASAHIEAEELRRQIEELKAALASKSEQIEELSNQLNATHQEPAAAQPQDKTAALLDRLSALSNVTATVKGAQTAAPVVWLSGETDAHKGKIESMGGKWSAKRGAWYFKV